MCKKLIYLVPSVLMLSLVGTTVSARELPVTDGLELRFDASAITGRAPGVSIITWDDTSGNDRHASGGDGGATYGEYILRGLGIVTFHDVYSESMAFDYSPNNKDITVIGVSRSRMQRSLMKTEIEREGQGWPHYHKGYIAWGEVGGFGVTTPAGFHMDNTYIMLGGGPGMRWELNYNHPELIEGFTINVVRLNSITGVMDVYRDGELLGERRDIDHGIQNAMSEGRIGGFDFYGGLGWDGDVAEILVYSRAITDEEMEAVEEYMYNKWLQTNYKARRPAPADGSLHPDTWVTLSWLAGEAAASHDVYLGENFDDVNDGTGDTFRGNQMTTFFIAGFVGFTYPEGLVPGITYYWRIDEVNDADPNSPWKGDVWSFSVPLRIAYDPEPSDGAKFVDSNVTLSWTPGHGAKLHTLYFGDDFDTVSNATGGTQTGATTYTPGTLEREKTYYWRVDEYDGVMTHTGDVWSFTTAREGGGLRGSYYHWSGPIPPTEPFQTLILEREDAQVNFAWIEESPDPRIDNDQFSIQWTGEVEIPFSGTWTFYTTSDDGVRLWVNDQLVVDNWTEHRAVENSGTIELVAGKYSLVMEYFEYDLMAAAQLRWKGPKTPKQVVPQAALSLPVKARSAKPSNAATGVKNTPVLTWGAGVYAVSHDVYFGTDEDAVRNATIASPEYRGTRALGSESYDPGKLAWHTTYYWRVDEVNSVHPDSPWIGNLWSFTTGDFLIIDDFEDYDVGNNEIWWSWKDGLGYVAHDSEPAYSGNGTGSAVGDETTTSYTEETIVHSGSQSMPLLYDNNKQGFAYYSEAVKTLSAPRDWTEENVAELSLWFRGYPASSGSFAEGPIGTYTMTGSGADIWAVNGVEADEFHFAYKMLTGAGSIVAKVDSVENTNAWAKAGVMIRETLDPDSAHAMMVVTPGSGVSFQRRPGMGQTSLDTTTGSITAPYWVKLERSISGSFTAYHSANGSTWETQGTENIPMGANVYVGLAVTAHNAAATCEAVFTNVTTAGSVGAQWAHQDIGITSNDAEPLYVAVSNIAGQAAVVTYDDPAAAQIDTWMEWIIPLQAFADQGIDLSNVDKFAIGLGTKDNMTVPGGSGKIFFDDIRLYRPRDATE